MQVFYDGQWNSISSIPRKLSVANLMKITSVLNYLNIWSRQHQSFLARVIHKFRMIFNSNTKTTFKKFDFILNFVYLWMPFFNENWKYDIIQLQICFLSNHISISFQIFSIIEYFVYYSSFLIHMNFVHSCKCYSCSNWTMFE